MAPALVIAADKIDITSAEITAILANPEFLKMMKKKNDSWGNGIEEISKNNSRYTVFIRKGCWFTFNVKSHVDSSSNKVVIDSMSNYGGACD
jgi:hypothetical protein